MLTTRIDELTLHNTGGGNGADIEITLTFAEHVCVAERRDIERQPKPQAPAGRDRFALSSELLDRASMNEHRLAHLVDHALARPQTALPPARRSDFKIHASTPPVVTGALHLMFELSEWGVSLDESRRYHQR